MLYIVKLIGVGVPLFHVAYGKIHDIIKSHLLNFSDSPLQLDFAVAET